MAPLVWPFEESGVFMRIAIIGACGKLGGRLVREGLGRGHQVVAICREPSVPKLEAFTGQDGITIAAAPVVSDEKMLTRSLAGCDAVVAVLIAVRRLKATGLVTSLARATAANGVRRLVFTAGEITAVRAAGETYTWRQRFMRTIVPPLLWLTPYSVTDMLKASVLITRQTDWEWTIVRAPTLTETPPTGYRLGKISDINGRHALSREDYAACLLDSLDNPRHHRCTLAVMPLM